MSNLYIVLIMSKYILFRLYDSGFNIVWIVLNYV